MCVLLQFHMFYGNLPEIRNPPEVTSHQSNLKVRQSVAWIVLKWSEPLSLKCHARIKAGFNFVTSFWTLCVHALAKHFNPIWWLLFEDFITKNKSHLSSLCCDEWPGCKPPIISYSMGSAWFGFVNWFKCFFVYTRWALTVQELTLWIESTI